MYISDIEPNGNCLLLCRCLLDVGQNMPTSNPALFVYQTWFALSYFFSQTLGELIGTIFMHGLFLLLFFVPTLNPILNDKIHVKSPIHVTLTYPYYYALRYALLKDYSMLKLPFPTCPLLFMYGSNKGAHFHGPKFIEKIKGTVGDKYIGKTYI